MGKQWKQCQTLFFWAPKTLQMVTAAMKLKDAYALEGRTPHLPCSISQYSDVHNLHSEKAGVLYLQVFSLPHLAHTVPLSTKIACILQCHAQILCSKSFLKQDTNSKRYMNHNAYSSIIYNSQDMEAT